MRRSSPTLYQILGPALGVAGRWNGSAELARSAATPMAMARQMQVLGADENIAADLKSRVFELSGRTISRIDLVYKTRKAWQYGGHAQLTVYGLS